MPSELFVKLADTLANLVAEVWRTPRPKPREHQAPRSWGARQREPSQASGARSVTALAVRASEGGATRKVATATPKGHGSEASQRPLLGISGRGAVAVMVERAGGATPPDPAGDDRSQELSVAALNLFEPCRSFALLTTDGTLLVARDQTNHPQLRSFLYLSERSGVRIEVRPVDFGDLTALQEQHEQAHSIVQIREVRAAKRLLAQARDAEASDVHIQLWSRYAAVQFRVNNSLYNFEQWPAAQAEALCRTLFQGLASVTDVSYNPQEFQDGQISNRAMLPEGVESVRLVRGPMMGGYFVVARLLYGNTLSDERSRAAVPVLTPPRAPKGADQIASLGFSRRQHDTLKRLMRLPSGMNIISGPTGSGKSTTLKIVLEQIMRQQPDMRVITIEDPPEYCIEGAIQLPVANARTDAEKAEAFADRVRVALRMDPDIIMIGEIRGAATANAALDAAMTGHQVWATVHTVDAFSIITRFTRMGLDVADFTDAYLLTGMIAQRLVKVLCPRCKVGLAGNEERVPGDVIEFLKASRPSADLRSLFLRGSGCAACEGKGVKGRSVVAEVVWPTQKLLDVIRERGVAAARDFYRQHSRDDVDMLEHGLQKVWSGEVDPLDLEEVVGLTRGRE